MATARPDNYRNPTRAELITIFQPLITPQRANTYKLRATQAILNNFKDRKGRMLAHLMQATTEPNKWFANWFMETMDKHITKTERQIYHLKERGKYLKQSADPATTTTARAPLPPLDTEGAKLHPIPDILANAGIQLIRNKFALRDEKTPSCNYYANNNNYYDFGAATGGDSIDLYMKIHGCDFVEAVKSLQ